MANFTPISAAIGGALIGLAAVLLMLFNGRIAGISGITDGLFNPRTDDWHEHFQWDDNLVVGSRRGAGTDGPDGTGRPADQDATDCQ